MSKSYEEAVSYILDIPKFAGKSGLKNVRAILDRLGSPDKAYRSVHVAGTNGKGSVSTMIARMLEEDGARVGLFTSPHLVDIRERITVNGELIDRETFTRLFNTLIAETEEGEHPSFFEFIFIMSEMYFREQRCDYVVYETGLGGRLDATNVITPVLSVITPIGMDHMQYLGDSIEKIAVEKAGIIKPGVPVVAAYDRMPYMGEGCRADAETGIIKPFETADMAHAVLKSVAYEKGSPFYDTKSLIGVIRNFGDTSIRFSVMQDDYGRIGHGNVQPEAIPDNLTLNSTSVYQVCNAVTAIRAYKVLHDCLGTPVSDDSIRQGTERFRMPARFDLVGERVIIDGAHNAAAAEMLVKSVRNYAEHRGIDEIVLLIAMSGDKDYESVVRVLCEGIKPVRVYVTRYGSMRSLDTEVLSETVREYISDLCVVDDSAVARTEAESYIKDDKLLVITGSLYLAGESYAEMK